MNRRDPMNVVITRSHRLWGGVLTRVRGALRALLACSGAGAGAVCFAMLVGIITSPIPPCSSSASRLLTIEASAAREPFPRGRGGRAARSRRKCAARTLVVAHCRCLRSGPISSRAARVPRALRVSLPFRRPPPADCGAAARLRDAAFHGDDPSGSLLAICGSTSPNCQVIRVSADHDAHAFALMLLCVHPVAVAGVLSRLCSDGALARSA